MRISELRERITLSFGDNWAASFSQDIALSAIGSLTVNEALAAGCEVGDIWRAICVQCPAETERYHY
jgi:hypothetical protein